jgi:hypothetical protein
VNYLQRVATSAGRMTPTATPPAHAPPAHPAAADMSPSAALAFSAVPQDGATSSMDWAGTSDTFSAGGAAGLPSAPGLSQSPATDASHGDYAPEHATAGEGDGNGNERVAGGRIDADRAGAALGGAERGARAGAFGPVDHIVAPRAFRALARNAPGTSAGPDADNISATAATAATAANAVSAADAAASGTATRAASIAPLSAPPLHGETRNHIGSDQPSFRDGVTQVTTAVTHAFPAGHRNEQRSTEVASPAAVLALSADRAREAATNQAREPATNRSADAASATFNAATNRSRDASDRAPGLPADRAHEAVVPGFIAHDAAARNRTAHEAAVADRAVRDAAGPGARDGVATALAIGGEPLPRAVPGLPLAGPERGVVQGPSLSIGRVDVVVENGASVPVYAAPRAVHAARPLSSSVLERFRLRS